MAEFETSAELSVELDDQSLRSVRDDIEDGIGSVPVSVEDGRATTGGSAMMDGGTGAVESQLDTTNDLLDDILDEVENSGGGGGFLGLGGGGGGGVGGGGGGVAGSAGAGAAGGLFARYVSQLGGTSGASAGGSVVFQSIIDQLTGRTPAFGVREFDQGREFNRENTGPIVTQVAEFLNLYDNQSSGQGGSGQESSQTDTVSTGSEAGGTDVGNDSGNDIGRGDVDDAVPDSTFDEDAGAGTGREPLVPGTDIGRGGGSGSRSTLSPVSGFVPPALDGLLAGNDALDGQPFQSITDAAGDLLGGGQQGTPDQVSVDVSVDNQRNQQQIVRDISREVEKSLGQELGDTVSGLL